MKSRVVNAIWYTPPGVGKTILDGDPNICIGIVAVCYGDLECEDVFTGWKCYIGYGRGQDETIDANYIADWGVPLGNKKAACELFPSLDRSKFQY